MERIELPKMVSLSLIAEVLEVDGKALRNLLRLPVGDDGSRIMSHGGKVKGFYGIQTAITFACFSVLGAALTPEQRQEIMKQASSKQAKQYWRDMLISPLAEMPDYYFIVVPPLGSKKGEPAFGILPEGKSPELVLRLNVGRVASAFRRRMEEIRKAVPGWYENEVYSSAEYR